MRSDELKKMLDGEFGEAFADLVVAARLANVIMGELTDKVERLSAEVAELRREIIGGREAPTT